MSNQFQIVTSSATELHIWQTSFEYIFNLLNLADTCHELRRQLISRSGRTYGTCISSVSSGVPLLCVAQFHRKGSLGERHWRLRLRRFESESSESYICDCGFAALNDCGFAAWIHMYAASPLQSDCGFAAWSGCGTAALIYMYAASPHQTCLHHEAHACGMAAAYMLAPRVLRIGTAACPLLHAAPPLISMGSTLRDRCLLHRNFDVRPIRHGRFDV